MKIYVFWFNLLAKADVHKIKKSACCYENNILFYNSNFVIAQVNSPSSFISNVLRNITVGRCQCLSDFVFDVHEISQESLSDVMSATNNIDQDKLFYVNDIIEKQTMKVNAVNVYRVNVPNRVDMTSLWKKTLESKGLFVGELENNSVIYDTQKLSKAAIDSLMQNTIDSFKEKKNDAVGQLQKVWNGQYHCAGEDGKFVDAADNMFDAPIAFALKCLLFCDAINGLSEADQIKLINDVLSHNNMKLMIEWSALNIMFGIVAIETLCKEAKISSSSDIYGIRAISAPIRTSLTTNKGFSSNSSLALEACLRNSWSERTIEQAKKHLISKALNNQLVLNTNALSTSQLLNVSCLVFSLGPKGVREIKNMHRRINRLLKCKPNKTDSSSNCILSREDVTSIITRCQDIESGLAKTSLLRDDEEALQLRNKARDLHLHISEVFGDINGVELV